MQKTLSIALQLTIPLLLIGLTTAVQARTDLKAYGQICKREGTKFSCPVNPELGAGNNIWITAGFYVRDIEQVGNFTAATCMFTRTKFGTGELSLVGPVNLTFEVELEDLRWTDRIYTKLRYQLYNINPTDLYALQCNTSGRPYRLELDTYETSQL